MAPNPSTIGNLLIAGTALALFFAMPNAVADTTLAAPAPNAGTCVTAQPDGATACSGGLVCVQVYPYSQLCDLRLGSDGSGVVVRPVVRYPVPPQVVVEAA